MKHTAIIQRDGDYWIGWIEGVPGVNCRERSYEKIIKTIEITLMEALSFEIKTYFVEEKKPEITFITRGNN